MGERDTLAARALVLLGHVQEAISIVDAAGRIVATSGKLRDSLGHPSSFWDGRTIFDLLAPSDRERAREYFTMLLETRGIPVTDEFEVIDATGLTQSVSVRATNLFHDPDVAGIVLSARNITRRRALFDELRAARCRASEEATRLRAELDRVKGCLGAPPAPRYDSFVVDRHANDRTAAVAAAHVVRFDLLDELVIDVGDRAIVCDVIDAYLGELDVRLGSIFDAAHDRDIVELELAVSRLAASSRVIGADAMRVACGAFAAGTTPFGDVVVAANRTRAALHSWVADEELCQVLMP
jgi:PAS domain S-box-containing protein